MDAFSAAFGGKADMPFCTAQSAFGGKADMPFCLQTPFEKFL